jgi:hypothetical protein
MQPNARTVKALGCGLALLLSTVVGGFAQHETVTSLSTSLVDLADQTRMGVQSTGALVGYSVTYNGIEQRIDAMVTANGTYVPKLSGVVYTRRNNGSATTPVFPDQNANVTTAWNSFVSSTNSPATAPANGSTRVVNGVYHETMDALFTSRNLYTGTENLFVNIPGTPGNVSSNVERMDFVFSSGARVAPEQSFAVFERGGGTGSRGGFKVALITGIDGAGVPTSFADTIITVGDDAYGNSNLTGTFNYDVYRNGTGAGGATPTTGLDWGNNPAIGPQGIAGALIKTTSFVSVGTLFYGYAVFGQDVTATNGAQLVDWNNNTYFPQNSPFTNDMDMVATGAVLLIPEPTTALLVLAGCLGLSLARRRRSAGLI